MDDDMESTEEVDVPPPPPPQSASESRAEPPNWFVDLFKTKNKLHGNVKVVVSDPLLRILRPGEELRRGEKFSHVQIVKGLWKYISDKGVYSPGSDYFATDEALTEIFHSEQVQFSEIMKRFQHHVCHSGHSIYSGYPMEILLRFQPRISFDNVS